MSVRPLRDNQAVRVAVVAGTGGSGLLRELAADGSPRDGLVQVKDLSAAVAGYEQSGPVRWVWASGARLYPALLRAGVRVARCHDVELTERLLVSRDGPESGPGASALAGLAAAGQTEAGQAQGALFDAAASAGPDPAELLDTLIAAHASQLSRIDADEQPRRFGMLAAAESAGGLVAAEMSFAGLPWRADVHDSLLAGMLGPRP